jgi:hypothetical protein
MALPVEGIVAIVGCAVCSLGGVCCWMMQKEENKRKDENLPPSLCCGSPPPNQPYRPGYSGPLPGGNMPFDGGERIGQLEAYINMKRAEAAQYYQGGQPIVNTPPMPTPAMAAPLQAPIQFPPRAVVLNGQYYAQPYQMQYPNAAAGVPVYYMQ